MISDSGKNLPLPASMNSSHWVEFLSQKIFPGDLEEAAAFSLLHYFQDLELLVVCDNDAFSWKELGEGLDLERQVQSIQNDLKKKASTKSGFALPFFIGFENIELPTIDSMIEPGNIKEQINIKPETTSDLSNLQIVKKVGKQLKPFLEAERSIVERLIGKHTNKSDARILFQYIFGKINSKAPPKKWEQLSRKRHR